MTASSNRQIVVCPLSRLAQTAEQYRPARMLSLVSEGTLVERPQHLTDADHLTLSFNDITSPTPGLVFASDEHMTALLEFIRDWYETGSQTGPLLVHCWAGVSRSTAGAYIVANLLNPDKDEETLAQMLRNRSPSATPNAHLVRLADGRLGRNGRMIRAIERIGRGADCFEGEVFTLPAGDPDGTSC
ncbi:tyrosine phosphatase family protein [Coralliovum pocilloporae]|uniref:tyrosine phosphatase family protein n=1 Tax=Coralliovum pocilloporae TaxID=3066369 RepID=UPI0033077E5C